MTTSTDAGRNAGDADVEIPCDAGFAGTTAELDRRHGRSSRAIRAIGYGTLLAVPFTLAVAVGYMKYLAWIQSETQSARLETVQVASASAVAMLSYRPDTVQTELDAAEGRMTGTFRDSYSSLVDEVVGPAAIQKLITSTATVAAASSVSATPDHAVVLLFVNQSVSVGSEPPRTTNSSVRVTLDNVDGRWLLSGFDPI